MIPKLRRSVAQEKKLAVELGGRRVAGSGNQPGLKGDIRTARWLVEAKQTIAGHYTLKLLDWRKIEAFAIKAGRHPVMVIEIRGRKLAVINYAIFQAFLDDAEFL